jgi:hypothetical protein
MSGTATIRAFGMTERFRKRNLELIDVDASLYFHKHAALEWLIFRIELCCSLVVTCTALLVVLKSDISAGIVAFLSLLSNRFEARKTTLNHCNRGKRSVKLVETS